LVCAAASFFRLRPAKSRAQDFLGIAEASKAGSLDLKLLGSIDPNFWLRFVNLDSSANFHLLSLDVGERKAAFLVVKGKFVLSD
jgi:hypothetical protein